MVLLQSSVTLMCILPSWKLDFGEAMLLVLIGHAFSEVSIMLYTTVRHLTLITHVKTG